MTTDIAVPIITHTVAGTGPYAVPWPYDEAELLVWAELDGEIAPLSNPAQWTASPTSTLTGGEITLAGAVATAFAGARLVIERATVQEQGWQGVQGREIGLTGALDRTMRAVQDLKAQAGGTLRILGMTDLAPIAEPVEGSAILWDGSKFAPGPTADDIALAQGYAEQAQDYAGQALISAESINYAHPNRASAQAWIAANPVTRVGTKVSWMTGVAALLQISSVTVRYVGNGEDLIEDMPGWYPDGRREPHHITENTVPRTTDMTYAVNRILTRRGVAWLREDHDFLITSQIRIAHNRVSLLGDGKDLSHLWVNSQIPDGIIRIEGPDRNAATIRQIEVSGFSIWCNTAQTAGAAFILRDLQHFTCKDMHLRNVCSGFDAEGLQQARISANDIFNSRETVIAGSFYFKLRATTGAAQKNTEIFLWSLNWRNVQPVPVKNTERGFDISSVDGIWIDASHVMGCTEMWHLEPQTNGTQLIGIEACNVWNDGYSDKHIVIRGNSTAGFGAFKYTGCKGINANVMCFDVGAECVNLQKFEINGGTWTTTENADWIGKIDGGTISIADASLLCTGDMSGAVAVLEFGAAASGWSVTGGIAGAEDGNFPIGIKMTSRTDPNASIIGVKFRGCNQEIALPTHFTDGTIIDGISTERNMATVSGVTAAADTQLLAVGKVINLTGAFTDVITDLRGGWDGREVILRASGSSRIIGHDVGTAGTKIIVSEFANRALAVGRFARAKYSVAVGAWLVT